MTPNPFRFLWRNIGSVLLAIVLAITVWISAVIANDPNVERDLSQHPALVISDTGSGLVQTNDLPTEVEVRLRAPLSVWEEIDQDPSVIRANVDISDLGEGEHVVPIEVTLGITPVQLVEVRPRNVLLNLETLISRVEPIRPLLQGEPALGYQASLPVLSQDIAQVSGPKSLTDQMTEIRATLPITGAGAKSINSDVLLTPMDSDGQEIQGLTITPDKVKMSLTIVQAGGYRDVAVKVETVGQPVSGYRVTNIIISPPTVTLFSSDPQLVAEMPGYVSTQSLDLTEIDDDKEVHLTLDLPEGVTIVGDEQSVQVQIGIAAVETSISLAVPITVIGLDVGLDAVVSPESIDILLTGPLPILDDLTSDSVIIYVDLTDLGPGAHLVVPEIEILSDRVVPGEINPSTIEITITENGSN